MPPVLLFIPLKQIFLSPRQREIDSLCKVHIDHRSSNGLCQFDCLYGGLQIRLPDFWIKITDIQILVDAHAVIDPAGDSGNVLGRFFIQVESEGIPD